ncbi:hypothetical protein PMIN06_013167 [Paraphaeosphaeria minitans]
MSHSSISTTTTAPISAMPTYLPNTKKKPLGISRLLPGCSISRVLIPRTRNSRARPACVFQAIQGIEYCTHGCYKCSMHVVVLNFWRTGEPGSTLIQVVIAPTTDTRIQMRQHAD